VTTRQPDALASARWMSVGDAAAVLGMPVLTLRRLVERSARRRPDGRVEARVDGIVARKCGRLWRVWLDAEWTQPDLARRSTAS
jgi:hypothetical protein